jgi:two-component system LytT family response regulator
MRTLIVDDSRLARAELRTLLAAHPQIELVGEAADVPQAISTIGELKPALLLLDVQLPAGTGFDVLSALEQTPQVIFTTAYDHYAVRAFEANALDYLVKPIVPALLASSARNQSRNNGHCAATIKSSCATASAAGLWRCTKSAISWWMATTLPCGFAVLERCSRAASVLWKRDWTPTCSSEPIATP